MKNEMLIEPCYVAYTSTDAKLIVAAHFWKNLRMLFLRGSCSLSIVTLKDLGKACHRTPLITALDLN
ncbi:unnamed protein product [Cylicocyclus nassatus]|uniref:Uncharacterized protein n=1 Tax=Cylicocyclus nassatus TaxID=53992 RepID=A0AA36M1W2_CYLNA|nr:unnamed protein product [Cylicocyclus nassatus]